MALLDLENNLLTVIVLFKVREGQQVIVLETVKQLFEIAKQQPGFVSANLHRSLDGFKVANYAQWESEAALEAFKQLPDVSNLVESLQYAIEEMDSHLYEIVASESKVGPPEIKIKPYFVHFAEFRMPAENQLRMVKLAKEHLAPAMSQAGLLSATFHRSLDGERVLNYGQWENAAAISKLTQHPGFGREDGYWKDLAKNEFHLYEVVLIESAAVN